MPRNKGGSGGGGGGGSSKEEGNHGLQGSSWQEIKKVLGVLPRKKGIMGYREVHGKK